MKLDKKVALITGAGRGIGADITAALAAEGYHLALCGRTQSAVDKAAELEQSGTPALGLIADVSDPEALRRAAAAAVERFGQLDVLVCNAGVNHAGSLATMAPERFSEMYAVNVGGVFFAAQAVLPYLIESEQGRIVNIASFTGRTPVAGFTAYSATKAAVLSLTRGHALELAEHGITVNAVCPGNVWSDIWSGATEELRQTTGKSIDEIFEDAVAAQPLRRPQTGAEVAAAVVFLCSPAAANITGEAIYVTGGA